MPSRYSLFTCVSDQRKVSAVSFMDNEDHPGIPGPSVRSLAMSILSTKPESKRLRNALATYTVGSVAVDLARSTYRKYRDKSLYTVAVKSDDDIYPLLHRWLIDQAEMEDHKGLLVQTERVLPNNVERTLDRAMRRRPRKRREAKLNLFLDGAFGKKISVNGHEVDVRISHDDDNRGGTTRTSPYGESMLMKPLVDRIVFSTHGAEGRDAVLALLDELAQKHNGSDRQPQFCMMERWGDWTSRSDLPQRTLETVILRRGQKERLVADLERFLDHEQEYARLGIPYHRGYLFHGPPGTGKTSIAKALANYFGLDVYFAPLADLEKDASLLRLVAGIRPGSMLLLEDIDVVHAATSREETPSTVSLSGLLNALDGVTTPHGLITVMTTNNRDALDEALLRPGRVDRQEEIGYLDDDQLTDLMQTFCPVEAKLPSLKDRLLAPGDVIEVLKRNLDDPNVAVSEIEALIATGKLQVAA